MNLAPDFNEFFASLIAHRVEFVVVGAHALAFIGHREFLENKAAAGRPKDLADIAALARPD